VATIVGYPCGILANYNGQQAWSSNGKRPLSSPEETGNDKSAGRIDNVEVQEVSLLVELVLAGLNGTRCSGDENGDHGVVGNRLVAGVELICSSISIGISENLSRGGLVERERGRSTAPYSSPQSSHVTVGSARESGGVGDAADGPVCEITVGGSGGEQSRVHKVEHPAEELGISQTESGCHTEGA